MKRTVTCGDLTAADIDRRVTLNGWVHRNRDHGAIQFVDLRDRYGVTQVVIDPAELDAKGTKKLAYEYCIAVEGVVRKRPENMINTGMAMGMLPVAGLPLSFISYGGSHLLICLIGIGLGLNVKLWGVY